VGAVLAVLAFVFNLLLIPELGILGAAVASFMAFFFHNTS
jgi:O-antigen/teichoic acid export membrane protein